MPKKVIKHLRQGTFLVTMSNQVVKQTKKDHNNFFGIYYRNLSNIIKYGSKAPRYAENIWVDPQNCTMALRLGTIKQLCGISNVDQSLGMVIESFWPTEEAIPVTEKPKIRFCIEHWVKGIPWEDTGVYEYMEKKIKRAGGRFDNCENKKDIINRYKNLDLIFEQAKQEGKLPSLDRVIICIGPGGELFYAGGGRRNHRFAIAYILKIPIQAQVGCVHVSAIPYLAQLRKRALYYKH